MNWIHIQGRCKQLKGKAKETWGNFTGNERTKIAGRREQFAGLLQERFGYTSEDKIGPLDEFAREVEM